MSARPWRERLDEFLRRSHPRLTVDELRPTDAKGYWETVEPCGPDCRHPLHSTLFNGGRSRHTVRFVEPTRERGRYMRPYRAWEEARAEAASLTSSAA